MILVHQRYFAKSGLRNKVIDTRVEASQRLAELGVPAGQLWVPVHGESRAHAGALPDIIWECTYPTYEEREEFRVRQESDPVFKAIRARQGTHLSHWAREYYRVLDLKA